MVLESVTSHYLLFVLFFYLATGEPLYLKSPPPGTANPSKYPSQVLGVAEQILFTERCEEALKGGDLSGYLIELEGQLDTYTGTEITPNGPHDRYDEQSCTGEKPC